jgi:hypothetical protein
MLREEQTEIVMIRIVAAGTFLAACLAGSGALAQGSYQHHTFCLKTGSAQECAFDSMAQCQAAKHANTDTCVPNSSPMNH